MDKVTRESELLVRRVLAYAGISMQECAERMGIFKQSLWTTIKSGALTVTDFEKILAVCGMEAGLVDAETKKSIFTDEYSANEEAKVKRERAKRRAFILDAGDEKIRVTAHDLVSTSTYGKDQYDKFGRRYELYFCPERDLYFLNVSEAGADVDTGKANVVDNDFAEMFIEHYGKIESEDEKERTAKIRG